MLPFGVGLCLTLLVLAGCGSSHESFPSLSSQQGSANGATGAVPAGWESISGDRFGSGSTVATVSAVAVNPVRLRLQVSASPEGVTETSYQVHCDQRSTYGRNLRAQTPLSREIALPSGTSSGKDVQCVVSARATKAAEATMTLTVIQDLGGTTPTHR